ncbi:MAG: hypothetical protein FWC69_01310 [Defluviitaleaceae bacterium]|nr:hypothetical protein [Defluviitaleaceae bacterium]
MKRFFAFCLMVLVAMLMLVGCGRDEGVACNQADMQLLAEALASFFDDENLRQPPEWIELEGSTHGVLVDVDGNGTIGVIATKWIDGLWGTVATTQRVFYVYNGALGYIDHERASMTVTNQGRLVARESLIGTFPLFASYALFAFDDGELVMERTLTTSSTMGENGHILNTYTINTTDRDFGDRDESNNIEISPAEFREMVEHYGLPEDFKAVWWLDDETDDILNKR